MKIHFCTENPCPLQDKEMIELLNNGFTTHYTVKLTDDSTPLQLARHTPEMWGKIMASLPNLIKKLNRHEDSTD